MKLRGKLLILLLAMALTPLVVGTIGDHIAIRLLGRELAAEARQDLLKSARLRLREQIGDYAQQVDVESRLVEALLSVQVQAVERRLAAGRTANRRPVYYEADFQAGRVPGLALSPHHVDISPDGTLGPLPVSYEEQVIRLPPGVDRQALTGEVAALSDMTRVYQHVFRVMRSKGLVLWQYTALASGLFSSFPGEGGLPDDYDPRERDWYRAAMAAAEDAPGEDGPTAWVSPVVDATTGQLTLTASRVVYGPDGRPAGVTAIDVPLTGVVSSTRLPADLGQNGRVLLVAVAPDEIARPGSQEPDRLYVFADEKTLNQAGDWRESSQPYEFRLEDPAQLRTMTQDVANERSNLLLGVFDGKETILAYGPIGNDAAVVLATPRATITRQVERMEATVWERTWMMLLMSTVVVGLVGIGVVLVALIGARTVTEPVERLAATARRIAGGDLNARAEIARHKSDEIGALAKAFNDMVPQLQDRLAMRESLNLAKEVQQALLPAQPPQLDAFDIAGASDYCDETGGDYFDFIVFEDREQPTLGVVIGDVVGHGVASALLMATARALLRSRATQRCGLAAVLTQVNDDLCASQFQARFMTMFYIELTSDPIHARWLSAGHDPALVYDPASDRFDELFGQDIPLSIQTGWTFNERQDHLIPWASGQVIFLGTDGIWEAFNAEGEMFGKDRLKDVIRAHAGDGAEQINQAVHAAVAAFRGECGQKDDITSVVIKIR